MGLKEWTLTSGVIKSNNRSNKIIVAVGPILEDNEKINVVEQSVYNEAIALLNKIGMMGMGDKAYHRDFTTEVNGMVRAFLRKNK